MDYSQQLSTNYKRRTPFQTGLPCCPAGALLAVGALPLQPQEPQQQSSAQQGSGPAPWGVLVEMGAGKGCLTAMAAGAAGSMGASAAVLLDCAAGLRHKV
jgi:hypothetical protein